MNLLDITKDAWFRVVNSTGCQSVLQSRVLGRSTEVVHHWNCY